MVRLSALLCMVVLTSSILAEDPVRSPKSDAFQGTVIKLANPVGKPTGIHRLLPDSLEVKSGNAAPQWLGAALQERQANQKWTEKNYAWIGSQTPIASLPAEEVRTFLAKYGPMFLTVKEASRLESCDWGNPPLTLQTLNNFQYTDTDIHSMRTVAAVLNLRARLQMKEGKLADALETIQVGLALGRHVGQNPTIISYLVGVAISSIFLQLTEEWIQQPGAPDLYWALTQLPTPLIDCRTSFRHEMNIFSRSFPQLRQTSRKPMSVEQVNHLVDELLKSLEGIQSAGSGRSNGMQEWGSRLVMTSLAAKILPDAKQSLLDHGFTREEIAAMPGLQVVLLHMQMQYEDIAEDELKWLSLPPWQALPGLLEASRRNTRILRESNPLLALLFPAMEKTYSTQVRLEWRISVLRTAEAMRLYASSHGGKPPAKLSDITEVPLPINPYTGRDFTDSYNVKDGVGVLEVAPQFPVIPSQALRFELTPTRP